MALCVSVVVSDVVELGLVKIRWVGLFNDEV